MSEIADTVTESVEHARESKLNSWIAVIVAVSATFMAICNIKDGNITQAMSQAQVHAVDSWSYYQAKSTKQMMAENTLTLLQATSNAKPEWIKKLEEKMAHYEKDKEEIKAKAEAFEKEYDDLNVFDDQFDMTDALMSISIALLGITALTQKKPLFYFACLLSASGFFFGIFAFMKISVHLGWVSQILG